MKINSKPSTSAINERIIASNAFYKLKKMVLDELEKLPNISILSVKKFELKGLSVPNTIKLDSRVI
jgi:hypothetical protein